MTRPLAALTGATGFLGVHLVRALDAAGFRVRVLARRSPSAPGWGAVEPEIVAGDLSSEEALTRLVEGAEVVVHNAGLIRAADRAAFMAVNRDGAARMAEAHLRADAGARFVLVSSLAARAPQVSAYAESKRAGETAVAALLGGQATLVRPPAIYGPGDRETFKVFRAAARSPVLPVAAPRARIALVHVEDAARAIAALAARPQPGTWALADTRPEGYGWGEILAAAARALGRRRVLVPLPDWALAPGARFGAAAGLIARDKVGEILHPDWSVRPHELAPDAPAPSYDLDRGFDSAANWYRQAGWLR